MRKQKASWFFWITSLPWWVGAVLAVAIMLFGWILLPRIHLATDFHHPVLSAFDAVLHSIPFHYLWGVASLLLLAASSLSAWHQINRDQLLNDQRGLHTIKALSWQAFERLVGNAYQRRGYRVSETGQGGADGGVDLVLKKDGQTILVQCKRWNSGNVGAAVVREMFGLMAHHKAAGVKVICAGKFSKDAISFAKGKPIELVDGQALIALIDGIQRGEPAAEDLACPLCKGPMTKRFSREGGRMFYGCLNFPKCEGTRPIF